MDHDLKQQSRLVFILCFEPYLDMELRFYSRYGATVFTFFQA